MTCRSLFFFVSLSATAPQLLLTAMVKAANVVVVEVADVADEVVAVKAKATGLPRSLPKSWMLRWTTTRLLLRLLEEQEVLGMRSLSGLRVSRLVFCLLWR